jgi:antitoxin component of MazEF toxin-antitoxin module
MASSKKEKNIYHAVKRTVNSNQSGQSILTYASRIRAIGNSRGIILNTKIMDAIGITSGSEIIIQAENGMIVIRKADNMEVNTDLSTWDKHFKAAIKKGATPEGDLFEGVINDFDKNEW